MESDGLKERFDALLKRQDDLQHEIWEVEGKKTESDRRLCELLCEKKEIERKIREMKREISGDVDG